MATAERPRTSGLRVLAAAAVLAAGAAGAGWLLAGPSAGELDPTAGFLLALAVILAVTHALGALARRAGQPAVLGQILGGLALGPSLLGLVAPDLQERIFSPDVLVGVGAAAQLGLVTVMFLAGCELRVDVVRPRRTVPIVLVGSMGLPLLAGVAIAAVAGGTLLGPAATGASGVFFLGLALSITALPVLAMILADFGLMHTRLGATAMSTAAIGDGAAWLVLTGILATTGTGSRPVAVTVALTAAIVLVVVLAVRPALAALVRHAERRPRGDHWLLATLVVGAIGTSAATQAVGLHPVIGAFLFGAVVPRGAEIVDRVGSELKGFALLILLPLFFAGAGLSTSVGLVATDAAAWLVFGVVLLAAVATKFAGAGAAARVAGFGGRDALRLGALMNCRGVTELVVATIGLQAGLLSPVGYTILVLVAVLTTAVTGPLLGLWGTPRASAATPATPATPPRPAPLRRPGPLDDHEGERQAMRWTDVYLESSAAVLGRAEDVESAVASGRYDPGEAAADGYLAISVVDEGPAVDLAVMAAQRALDRSATAADRFALVLHSSCGDQGLDHFAPASYVQGRTIGGLAPAMEVKQYSNGGLAAVEVAAAYLGATGPLSAALLTTSDVFVLPGFDRYRSDKGVVFGDGGTALVLTRDRSSAVARLLSTSVISDGTYGAVYIGGDPGSGRERGDGPVDLRARREEYLVDNVELLLDVVESMTARQRESIEAALVDAGVTAPEIDRWVLTNVGLTMADLTLRADVGIPDELTTWEWGRRVGHVGAADQVAGLTHLLESGAVGPGDCVALCGVGMGFTYASAVVEILDRPSWQPTAAPGGPS